MQVVDMQAARAAKEAESLKIVMTDSALLMQGEIAIARDRAARSALRTATDNVAIFGPSGCGKTTFLRSHAATAEAGPGGAIYIDGLAQAGTTKQVLQAIIEAIDSIGLAHDYMDLPNACLETRNALSYWKERALRPGEVFQASAALARFLSDMSIVLLLDEAQRLRNDALDTLRMIADRSGVPMVFAGNEMLYEQIKPGTRARMEQFSSRIGAFVHITENDMEADAAKFARQGLGVTDKAAVDWLARKARTCGGLRFVARIVERVVTDGDALTLPSLTDAADVLGFGK